MNIVFIAPAAGRRVNCKHFLKYTPGGEGGGVNYDAFPDFYRHPQFQNAECVPLVPELPSKSVWEANWRLAGSYELELRAQFHRAFRFLEEHPLSEQEYERLIDLTAGGPLIRKKLDERLERLGLVEEYDSEAEESAVECTQTFYSYAYGQYESIPYDGILRLPYIDIHGKLCHLSQHTAVAKVLAVLQPDLVKEWLEEVDPPEMVIGRTSKCSGCPLATYILAKTRIDVQVGNAWDLSSFSYEGKMHDLPDWAVEYAQAIDEFTISYLDEETDYIDDKDMYSRYPDYPSVPVKAKHALAILEGYLKEAQS